MSEVSEGLPAVTGQASKKEAPAVTLVETATGIALKALIPSAAHGREELDRYRGYKLLHNLGSAAELAGIGMTVGGQEIGPAMYVAGKFTAFFAEARAIAKERRKFEPEDVSSVPAGGVEGEPEIIKVPSRIAGAVVKVLGPSFLVAGKVEQKGYALVVRSAKAAEILGPAVGVAMGSPELAVGTYVGGKALALFAEAADRAMPRVKEKLRALKNKGWPLIRRGAGGVVSAGVWGAGKAREVAGRATVTAGPVLRGAGAVAGEKFGQALDAARQRLGGIFQKTKGERDVSSQPNKGSSEGVGPQEAAREGGVE